MSVFYTWELHCDPVSVRYQEVMQRKPLEILNMLTSLRVVYLWNLLTAVLSKHIAFFIV